METLPRIGEQLSDSSSATNHRLSTAERDFKAAFRAAALSITNLYKGGLGTSKKAYSAGYSAALQDVLEFIQGGLDFQSTNGMGDLECGRGANGTRSTTGGGARPADDHRMALTIGRVIDYIEARQETIRAESDAEGEDDVVTSRAPIERRQQQQQPQQRPFTSDSRSSFQQMRSGGQATFGSTNTVPPPSAMSQQRPPTPVPSSSVPSSPAVRSTVRQTSSNPTSQSIDAVPGPSRDWKTAATPNAPPLPEIACAPGAPATPEVTPSTQILPTPLSTHNFNFNIPTHLPSSFSASSTPSSATGRRGRRERERSEPRERTKGGKSSRDVTSTQATRERGDGGNSASLGTGAGTKRRWSPNLFTSDIEIDFDSVIHPPTANTGLVNDAHLEPLLEEIRGEGGNGDGERDEDSDERMDAEGARDAEVTGRPGVVAVPANGWNGTGGERASKRMASSRR